MSTVLSILSYLVPGVLLILFVLHITSPKVQDRKASAHSFFEIYIDMETCILIVLIIGVVVVSVIKTIGTGEKAEQAVAEKYVQLFSDLSPDLTAEEMKSYAEEYGMYLGKSEYYPTKGENYTEYTVYADLDDTRDGVTMKIAYSVDDIPVLLYGYLRISTADGIASCYYYPADYTLYDGETGYNLTVRGQGKLFSSEYLLDTAEEAIDIAYAAVFPDNLA